MISFPTERLIAKSEMIIANGRLQCITRRTKVVDIFKLPEITGLESGFKFYDIGDENVEICHIGITWQRRRFEVSYGTEEEFRKRGYMKEALSHLVNWIFANTEEPEIWGIPNGVESESILKSTGFRHYGPMETEMGQWYRIENPNIVH